MYALSKGNLQKIIGYIKQPIVKDKGSDYPSAKQELIADELSELQKLREQGIILESEYLQKKQELMKKSS